MKIQSRCRPAGSAGRESGKKQPAHGVKGAAIGQQPLQIDSAGRTDAGARPDSVPVARIEPPEIGGCGQATIRDGS